jgi:phage terminase large subunit
MPTTTPTENLFTDFLRRYLHDPSSFVADILKIQPDAWQRELMDAVARGERKISVRSGHGVGKSTVTSWVLLWHILFRYPSKAVVTAPTSAQLFDALFAELKGTINNLPPVLRELLDVKTDRIELKAAPTESFISARTSRAEQPEALAGVHSEYVLLIADEASGIPESVFEAASGSMSGHSATTILLGNPTRSSGYFYDTHNRLRSDWWTRRVSCLDSSRVSAAYIAEMGKRYGEESNAFRIRVLGEFPLADNDTMIPIDLIDGACDRDVASSPTASVLWGLDVARFGSDSSALCKRQSNVVTELRTWRNLDLMQLCGAVINEYESSSVRPAEILVDSIGLGAGVVDRLRELGLPVRGINVSESPSMAGTYRNLRAELWGKAKAWLERRDCKLPRDDRLSSELATVRYSFSSSGKLQIESKDDIRRRGLPSPDVADAFVLTFAADAASIVAGSAWGAGSWNKPLVRAIPRLR